jgi:hypothetical protein
MFRGLLLSGVMLLLTNSAIFASDVAIFPVSITNLTNSQGDAIGAVMAQQYARISHKSVLNPAQTLAAVLADSGNLLSASQKLGVNEYVTMNAVALQSRILIEAILYDNTGKEVYRTQMTSASLDDIQEACDRMAGALINRATTEETMNLDNVTEREGQEKNRLFVEKVKGVKTHVIYPIASEKLEAMVAVGFDMRMEGKNYFLEFGAAPFFPTSGLDMTGNNKYGGAYLELGGSYYFRNDKFISPYVGGGISPRFIVGPSTGIGIAPFVQVGATFLRVSKMRMYADLRIAQNIIEMVLKDTNYYSPVYNPNTGMYETRQPNPDKHLYPTEIGLEIGMSW